MRGEKIKSEIIDQDSDDYFQEGYCNLCTMEREAMEKEPNALRKWYDNYRRGKDYK